MSELANPFQTLTSLKDHPNHVYYSLPKLQEQGIAQIQRLPVCIRIMLESLLRNCDENKVTQADIQRLAAWTPKPSLKGDVPFVVSRVILQDFTGVPLLVDLAAMRDAVALCGFSATLIEPQVPVDLVVDHSVQVDRSGTADAFLFNLKTEFERNHERYSFLKWGQEAFKTFQVVPPGIGIVHQVNLEHLATVVTAQKQGAQHLLYPDTLVGTDSHTTMINGLGVVGWGVGGIEAESAMLGQPVSIEMPEVIGVCLEGELQKGVTATDLTLRITELLRKEKVVGKFVEFFGSGAASLSVVDRATIGNMAPEYGATMGFFPVDEKTLAYLKITGRTDEHIALVKAYLQAQQLFGIPSSGQVDYTQVITLDLNSVKPCVAGPKRPQDRIDLTALKSKFGQLLTDPIANGGYGKTDPLRPIFVCSDGTFHLGQSHITGGVSEINNDDSNIKWSESEMVENRPFTKAIANPGYAQAPCDVMLKHGSIVIAAITSCTNTSNPNVMIGAGLLAKKAVQRGLSVNHMVKTSLAPGSRVVSDYLENTGLQPFLNQLGFQLVAYGCTTCIGNSGPLEEHIETAIKEHDVIAASVLSGNRNFEARIHSSVKANFLMSPPLVVAFAIAGRIDIDFDTEPLAMDPQGKPVFLHEIWPSAKEIQDTVNQGIQASLFQKRYAHILDDNPMWKEIAGSSGAQYAWDKKSTYIQHPPYFENFSLSLPKPQSLSHLRCLALFGDSVTTDHISPAGAFRSNSPAGEYLLSKEIKEGEFNSYGSRRGNHQVMMRGTFANVRIRNQMAEGKEGGYTKYLPDGKVVSIYDACQGYAETNTPLILFAGRDYGMGSSRDWAAKGSALLGIRVVVARSFERIHRSNLIGMGVLPLEFLNDQSHESHGLTGAEIFSVKGLEKGIQPHQQVSLEVKRGDQTFEIPLRCRIDTLTELDYYLHGGILPYVLRSLLPNKK